MKFVSCICIKTKIGTYTAWYKKEYYYPCCVTMIRKELNNFTVRPLFGRKILKTNLRRNCNPLTIWNKFSWYWILGIKLIPESLNHTTRLRAISRISFSSIQRTARHLNESVIWHLLDMTKNILAPKIKDHQA